MNDSEGKPLTLSELRAMAEEQDRRNGLTSKARGRRGKREEVSEETLLSLGGKKAGAEIVFGPEGETQLIFRPSRGSFKGAARWTVSLKGNISRYDTQRELNKANRGLWDKEKGKPSISFEAATQLLAYYTEIEPQLRRRLQLLLLRRLHEKAKQEGVSLIIEPDEAAEDTPYIYPKPEIDTLREQLAMVEEQLNTVSGQLIMAHDAISLTVEALSKGLGIKLQKGFDLLRDDQWPQEIPKLRDHVMMLACKLQRPPSKKELKELHGPDGRIDPSKFAKLLKHAGLSWLRREC